MQMMVSASMGRWRGSPPADDLIAPEAGSPLQVLVTNEGVSSGVFTVSGWAESFRPSDTGLNLNRWLITYKSARISVYLLGVDS